MQKRTSLNLVRQNLRRVKQLYPELESAKLTALRDLTETLHLSLSGGEILCLDGRWYVTHGDCLNSCASTMPRNSHSLAGATVRSPRQPMGF